VAPVKSLTELRDWNKAHEKMGTLKYGQSQLDASDALDLEKDRAKYEEDRARDIRLFGTRGIDAAVKANNLDALLFPGPSSAGIASKPGYPTVLVPFGMIPNTPLSPGGRGGPPPAAGTTGTTTTPPAAGTTATTTTPPAAGTTATTTTPQAAGTTATTTTPPAAGTTATTTTPQAPVPFPPGFEAKPQPYGVGFTGPACSEPKLLQLAYDFEQATKKRTPPGGLR
jgi:hypothetical protein